MRDGRSVTDGRFSINGVFGTTTMTPDLVGEVRLVLTPVDAESGRGNAQVQIFTRSGTNRFSGSAVWNVRNTALDPNTWLNNHTIDPNTGKPAQRNWYNNHEYSIAYGGPIKKNKTFFYALWEQNRQLFLPFDAGPVYVAANAGPFCPNHVHLVENAGDSRRLQHESFEPIAGLPPFVQQRAS
jgi:hypothetical protein